MPQTASNWLNLVASGLMLAVAGMMLRKIRV
jgi:LPXTG-motif cell wall-anchored protein